LRKIKFILEQGLLPSWVWGDDLMAEGNAPGARFGSNEPEAALDASEISQIGINRVAGLLSEWSGRDPALRRRLSELVRNAKLRSAANRELSRSIGSAREQSIPSYIVGSNLAMTSVFDALRRYAPTSAPILILGETGTGKELIARALHQRSKNEKGPFIAIDCGALPSTLIGSELFGYEKGAFTGADARKVGRIELAQNGTVFLDEIGDLPLELQGHLMRFLQEGTINRIGGYKPIPVNARVIAATNIDLSEAVSLRTFRNDLYYRLNVLTLKLPPLRERGDDVLLLARFFLNRFCQEFDHKQDHVLQLTEQAERFLTSYSWPGNVRELIACIRRAVLMADQSTIEARHFGIPGIHDSTNKQDLSNDGRIASPGLTRVRNNAEANVIEQTLKRHNFNVSKAARQLAISRVTLYRMIKKYGISIDR
jgi:DNA-binding NtrC family response regulator